MQPAAAEEANQADRQVVLRELAELVGRAVVVRQGQRGQPGQTLPTALEVQEAEAGRMGAPPMGREVQGDFRAIARQVQKMVMRQVLEEGGTAELAIPEAMALQAR